MVSLKKINKKKKIQNRRKKTGLNLHFIIFLFSIVIFEFLKFTKFTNILKQNIILYRKIIKLIKFKYVSEIWKEKALLRYSQLLFLTSIKILSIIITIIFTSIFINFYFYSFLKEILSIYGFIEIAIIFLLYHHLRNKIYAKL